MLIWKVWVRLVRWKGLKMMEARKARKPTAIVCLTAGKVVPGKGAIAGMAGASSSLTASFRQSKAYTWIPTTGVSIIKT